MLQLLHPNELVHPNEPFQKVDAVIELPKSSVLRVLPKFLHSSEGKPEKPWSNPTTD